ncbi:hypothetical protein [Nostoc sp.]
MRDYQSIQLFNNHQCPIRSLAHDDRTIKVKKLEQRPIATFSSN